MLMPALLHDDFDLFDGFSFAPWWGGREFENMEKKLYGHRAQNVMRTDIRENENGYEMEIDLPGFKKEDVSVELEDGYLTICAAKGFEREDADKGEKAGKYICRERYAGSCKRSYYVGEQYNQDDIKAKFEHGMLSLAIPKKSAEKIENKKYIAIEG